MIEARGDTSPQPGTPQQLSWISSPKGASLSSEPGLRRYVIKDIIR
jgi:hypothetical protein